MKQFFIKKQAHTTLTLFFAGWAMDKHPFADYTPADSDLLMCYDYRSLEFDFALLQPYESIRLVAWSMGVWAASVTLANAHLPIVRSIAINGTPTPVNDTRGIPPSIFAGTLNGLNEATLRKFFRRMCGSGEALNRFLEKRPQRPVEELKEELFLIARQAETLPVSPLAWTDAVVGSDDLIFTVTNQQQAWSGSGATIAQFHIPHYSETLLRNTICSKQ